MTDPEQWAVELRETLKRLSEAKQDYLMDVAIQRAFEERERKLREALDPFARVARLMGPISKHWPDDKPNIEFIPSAWPDWGDFKRASQALKEPHP